MTGSDHTITAPVASESLAEDLDAPSARVLLVVECQLYASAGRSAVNGQLVSRPDVLRLWALALPSATTRGELGSFGVTAVS